MDHAYIYSTAVQKVFITQSISVSRYSSKVLHGAFKYVYNMIASTLHKLTVLLKDPSLSLTLYHLCSTLLNQATSSNLCKHENWVVSMPYV